jgi:poly-gamma-glutamate synthesis protein (capsule biosynthesis protein)
MKGLHVATSYTDVARLNETAIALIHCRGAVVDVTLFLCGDVMTGRGIDQALPHPCDPILYEEYIRDARDYLRLAEEHSGSIPRAVAWSYVWGDSLAELAAAAPDARIVNLETSVTRSGDYWRAKGIHYRMHPDNIGCLAAAGIDVCALANNHVLDYGYPGLLETLATLRSARIGTAGAGRDLDEAQRPAEVPLPGGARLWVLSLGSDSSGVPLEWAATDARPGVDRIADLTPRAAESVVERVRRWKRPGDLVLASVHWGGNWGHGIPEEHRDFAHRLIDGGVDVVHGHSSHHPRSVEVHGEKVVLYGCGDFIDDYEGIGGYEEFRGDLALMYLATVDAATGALRALRMVPFQMRRFRLRRAPPEDARWLRDRLAAVSSRFGTRIALVDGELRIQ